MEIVNILNPVYTNPTNTQIDCTLVVILQPGQEPRELPFTAHFDDVEPHGRVIFARILKGDFGTIGAYVVPKPLEDLPNFL